MKLAFVTAALAAALAPAAQAQNLVLEPGATTANKVSSPVGTGFNTSYFLDGTATSGTCGADAQTLCFTKLVEVTGGQAAGTKEKNLKFRIDGFSAASDFDLRVYDANAAGVKGAKVGSPRGDSTYDETLGLGTLDPRNTSAGDFERTVLAGPKSTAVGSKFYFVEIPYFAVVNDKVDLSISWSSEAPF